MYKDKLARIYLTKKMCPPLPKSFALRLLNYFISDGSKNYLDIYDFCNLVVAIKFDDIKMLLANVILIFTLILGCFS